MTETETNLKCWSCPDCRGAVLGIQDEAGGMYCWHFEPSEATELGAQIAADITKTGRYTADLPSIGSEMELSGDEGMRVSAWLLSVEQRREGARCDA